MARLESRHIDGGMHRVPAQCVHVVVEYLFNMNQRTLAWAIAPVLQSRERNWFVICIQIVPTVANAGSLADRVESALQSLRSLEHRLVTTAISLKEFRAHTDEIIDTVVESEETVIVTLADGRKFVLVPGAEWQSMDETSYPASTANNRAALAQSLTEAAQGKTVEVDL